MFQQDLCFIRKTFHILADKFFDMNHNENIPFEVLTVLSNRSVDK